MRIHLQSLVFGMFQDLDYYKSVVLWVIHTDSVIYFDQIMSHPCNWIINTIVDEDQSL